MLLPKSLTTVTMFSKILAVLVFFIFLFGSFQFGMKYQHVLDVQQHVPLISPVPTTLSPQAMHATIVNMDANGKTEEVKVGDRVLLQLAEGLDWSIQLSNATVLQPSSDGVFYIRATQGRYKAVMPGTVDIIGSGRPNCPKGAMCSQLIVAFHTTVQVTQ